MSLAQVKDVLRLVPAGTVVKVFQTPIARIDACHEPVLRGYGDVQTLRESNQNYLKFEAIKLYQDSGIIAVLCKANAEQETKIIAARYDGCTTI